MRYQLSRTRRSGFTLIELIIVVAILVVIASLTIGAVSKSMGWIKKKNTEQTMTKLMQRLQNRKMAMIQKDAEDWSVNSPVYQQAEFNVARDRVLKIKYLTKWSYPMTYAEAFHNVQESRLLFDPLGYPPAVAILRKLQRGAPWIPDPFQSVSLVVDAAWPTGPYWAGPYWPATTVAAAAIPSQNAACLHAIYESCLSSSGDELSPDEVAVDSSPTSTDLNPRIVDAWGSPMMFLRYGNMSPTCSMGMVAPATPPLTTVFSDTNNLTMGSWTVSLATRTLATRAVNAYPDMQPRVGPPNLIGKDPEDPEATLVQGRFFSGVDTYYPYPSPAVAGTGWMLSPPYRWLPTIGAGAANGTYFLATFGYELPPGFPNNNARNNIIYAPFVIISAGGDKLWNTWDDNLDSYRLRINTSGQQ